MGRNIDLGERLGHPIASESPFAYYNRFFFLLPFPHGILSVLGGHLSSYIGEPCLVQ